MADEGLSGAQFRLLVFAAVAIGALLLIAIIGVTAASVIWGGGSSGPPSATFDVQTIDRPEGVAANVTHVRGDAVNPDDLVIEVNGEPRGTWAELGGQGPDVVAPGHRLRYGNVTPGDSMTVVWGEGEDRTQLGTGTIDQGTTGVN